MAGFHIKTEDNRSIYERLSDDKPATFEDTIVSGEPDPARSAEIRKQYHTSKRDRRS